MDTHGGYRFTLAALLGLVLSAITTGAFLEKHVLAATAKPDFAVIAQAWNLIQGNYVDRAAIRPERMTHAAISGMVDSLGDTGHSVFLTPQMVREDNEQMRGRFPGIGAEVRMRDKQVVVVAPLDGSPAQKAGLRAGDIVFRVDGKDVAGETLVQVVRSIRGPAGTTVVLSVRDPQSDRTRQLTMVRAVIHVHNVSWGFLPGTRVADLRIAAFSKGTAAGLRQALADARARWCSTCATIRAACSTRRSPRRANSCPAATRCSRKTRTATCSRSPCTPRRTGPRFRSSYS